MTYAYSATITTDAGLLDIVKTTMTTAGWTATTNANPYNTGGVDYYVLKSLAASNSSGVEWYMALWLDTTNHRLGIMPFEQFSDVATPQYRKFCPGVGATPGGDGYHQQALQNLGSFTGSPGGIVLERSTAAAGTCVVNVRATLDAVVVGNISHQAAWRGGYAGSVDFSAGNTERPALVCLGGALLSNLFLNYAALPPTMAAALPAGTTPGGSGAKDLLPLIHGASTQFNVSGGNVGHALNTAAGGSTYFNYGWHDAIDPTHLDSWDYLIWQWPITAATAATWARIKIWGKLRDIVCITGMMPLLGDSITVGTDTYRAIGTHVTPYQRSVWVKAT